MFKKKYFNYLHKIYNIVGGRIPSTSKYLTYDQHNYTKSFESDEHKYNLFSHTVSYMSNNYDYDHHVHKLKGFYDTNTKTFFYIEYIDIIKKSSGDVNVSIVNDNKYIKHNINKFKNLLIIETKEKYPDEYYNIDVKFYDTLSDSMLIGGEIEDPPVPNYVELPTKANYLCEPHDITGFIAIYSEPVIENLESLILEACRMVYSYLNMTSKLSKICSKKPWRYNPPNDDFNNKVFDEIMSDIHGLQQYSFMIPAITSVRFDHDMLKNSTFHSAILKYHLTHHKYAHNGIDDIDTLNKVATIVNSNIDDYVTLQFIHSYLHIFDALYMYKKDSDRYKIEISYLQLIRDNLFDNIHIKCTENMLNKNKYDFILKTGAHTYATEYDIKKEARKDKQRQYESYMSQIHENYKKTLQSIVGSDNGRDYNIIGESVLIPPGIERYSIQNLNKIKCLHLKKYLDSRSDIDIENLTEPVINDIIHNFNTIIIPNYDIGISEHIKSTRRISSVQDFMDCITWLKNQEIMTNL